LKGEKEMTGVKRIKTGSEPFAPKKEADADTKEPFENPEDVFISPSRTYVISTSDSRRSNDKHVFKVVVPENPKNTINGARNYFHSLHGYTMEIDDCEPYEQYEERTSLRPKEDQITEADVDNCLGVFPLPELVALLGSEVEAYLDKLPVEALAKLLHADMKAYLDALETLKEIKVSLAAYYDRDIVGVKNKELPGMIEELKTDCFRYSLMVSGIKQIIKD
jgi:hypothetical protein